MKTKILIALLAVTLSSAYAGNGSCIKDGVKEMTGFKNPESVIVHKDHLFVSNTGEKLDPTAKDGDGYISLLNRKDGKMIEEKFITGLNSPKGMYVKRNVLYVTDIDKVVGYNIKTKKKVYESDLTKYGVSYANDIAKAPRGFYVSNTLNNGVGDGIFRLYRKNPDKVKQLDVKGAMLGANGLYRKPGGRLYVANYGRDNQPDGSFGMIKRVSKKYVAFHQGGVYDGTTKRMRRVYVTDWSADQNTGRLLSYKRNKKQLATVNLCASLGGPSDIYADKRERVLYVPAMVDNKVLAVAFNDLKK